MPRPIKMILIGDSGAGKTGSLASLLDSGFNVRVIDLENGIEALLDLVASPKSAYKKDSISRLHWQTFSEKQKILPNKRIVPATARVWEQTVDMLTRFHCTEKKTDEFPILREPIPAADFGSPLEWTDKDVFVVDTLGALGLAAKNYHLALNSNLDKIRDGYAGMKDVGSAQEYLDTFIGMIAGTFFRANVILITHMTEATRGGGLPKRDDKGNVETDPATGMAVQTFLFPSTIGRAQTKNIAKLFNHVLLVERVGVTATIYTKTRGNILLKTGAPTLVKDSYPQPTGLAQYFKDVRNESA